MENSEQSKPLPMKKQLVFVKYFAKDVASELKKSLSDLSKIANFPTTIVVLYVFLVLALIRNERLIAFIILAIQCAVFIRHKYAYVEFGKKDPKWVEDYLEDLRVAEREKAAAETEIASAEKPPIITEVPEEKKDG